MTNEESALGSGRRTPRQGMGGSPVGSWLTIVLAVVAVVIGFLILNNITDDDSTGGDLADAEADDADAETAGTGTGPVVSVDVPVTEASTTTTAPARTTTGASVMVANANTVGGSAGTMTKSLEVAGYTVVDPVDASGPNISATIVYYDESQDAAQAVANSVASDLGDVDVLVLPNPAPTESGDIGDAGVLVLLGDDEAGKTLEELSGGEATTEAPDPSSGETPATSDGAETGSTEG